MVDAHLADKVGWASAHRDNGKTTAKQQADWRAEAHPTASGNRPTSRRSGKETESNYGYAKQSEKID
ncbi:hypothetical protein [Neisseria lactamica]|uniref:hypothetical protein n=1 Tax=Neisseria lactamica TaxID=486 RepID=UPI001864C514|nr:hypothetical protein [Neisseria lactamica]